MNQSKVHNYLTNSVINLDGVGAKIKTVLKKHRPRIKDEVTSIKLKGAIKKIDEIKQKKHVDEATLTSVLRYYDLVNELKEIK